MKAFVDDNFKFDENGRKFSKWVKSTVKKGRKHLEKRRNCLLQAIFPFLTMFTTAIYL